MDEAQAHTTFSSLAVHGTLWTYAARYGGKLINLAAMLGLVRLLTQEDFGVAAYALAAVNFLRPLASLGISAAVIYLPDDEDLASTAFWLGLATALGVCLLVWLGAPLAGLLFQDPRAIPVTRLLALSLPLAALGSVHESLVQKQLAFQRQTLPSLAKAAAKGSAALGLAALGLGAWSLIWGELAGMVVWAGAYWAAFWWAARRFAQPASGGGAAPDRAAAAGSAITGAGALAPGQPFPPARRGGAPLWQPWRGVHAAHARRILAYGGLTVAVNLLAAFMANADLLLVGRYLGAALLGVYSVALRVPDLLLMQFYHVLSKVLFPAYARIRHDPPALRRAFLQTLAQVSLLAVPAGLGLAVIARPFVQTFFAAGWEAAIPVLQALALYALLRSFERQSSSLLKAQGRLKLLLGLIGLRSAVLLPGLWWAAAVLGSLTAAAWVYTGVALASSLVHLALVGRLLRISAGELLAAVRAALLCGALMAVTAAAALSAATALSLSPPGQMLAAVLVGAASYAWASWSLQRQPARQLSRAIWSVVSRAGAPSGTPNDCQANPGSGG